MSRIVFNESNEFYSSLDSLLKENKKVTIAFSDDRPSEKSKLWKRLRHCKNWSSINSEFKKIKSGKSSKLSGVISPGFQAALTGGEILLIVWIATLVAGAIFYAVYKGYKVRLKVNISGDGELELEPV